MRALQVLISRPVEWRTIGIPHPSAHWGAARFDSSVRRARPTTSSAQWAAVRCLWARTRCARVCPHTLSHSCIAAACAAVCATHRRCSRRTAARYHAQPVSRITRPCSSPLLRSLASRRHLSARGSASWCGSTQQGAAGTAGGSDAAAGALWWSFGGPWPWPGQERCLGRVCGAIVVTRVR